jgi:uncharacterized cysteine cluster protein YcgN (CxxCxxCC family)
VTRSTPPPFWEVKHYREYTRREWESLCDGCGRCCVFRLEDESSGECFATNVCCDLLDASLCRCTDYVRRSERQPFCITLTPAVLDNGVDWLPATCAYRLVAEGQALPWWHPLVSGDAATVLDAGISVAGRVIHERDADDLEQHIVDADGWID